jgi:O-antigen/teichoic acid export membrane protein
MSIIRRNIFHNIAGRIITGVLGIVFVPIYIRYLGIEAFGIVGFFVSLQAIVIVLDMGLCTTTSREVARQIGESGDDDEFRSLMYSLELIYVVSAAAMLGLFVWVSDWLADEWIKAEGIPFGTLHWCILSFGFTIAVRWPCGFYSGVLTGAEKQVLYNCIYTTFSLLKSAGSVCVVALISSTIEAFAAWQAFVASAEVVVMKLVYRRLSTHFSGKTPARFRIDLIRRVWRFSAGIGLNTILAIGIKQLDRILISGMLPIALLGYYTSAHLLYSGLVMIAGPFCTATFPRFAKLCSQNKNDDLARLYHKSSQLIAFIVAPVASVLFFFPFEILYFWTQSESVAQNTSTTLTFLSIAGLFNSIMQLPWKLQLAAGVTWMALLNNSVNLVLFAPVTYFLIDRYGLNGAGLSWLIFNVIYFMVVPHLMHRSILSGHKRQWIFKDNLFFCVISFAVFGSVFVLCRHAASPVIKLAGITGGSVLYALIALGLYSDLRTALLGFMLPARLRS